MKEKVRTAQGIVGGLCDPKKAYGCKKENCYINGGNCRSTTNVRWIKESEKKKWLQE